MRENIGISRSTPSQTSQGETGHTNMALYSGAPTPTLSSNFNSYSFPAGVTISYRTVFFCSSSDPPWMFLPWGLHLCCLPCLFPCTYLAGSWSSFSSLLKYQPCPLCTLSKTALFPQVTSVTLLYIHRAPIAVWKYAVYLPTCVQPNEGDVFVFLFATAKYDVWNIIGIP